ncbi:MAG: acetylxylan esterase [Acidobacteria bacterium]|nr:acetylxylan esterase [Acidobacteriota bacterium]
MTRRQLLASTLAAPLLRAQASREIRYREYARCLPDYLAALAGEAYARRNARIARLGTAEAVREYQAWARSTFVKLAGALPQERTPPNLRTVGEFEREHYRVEKVVYESQPGLHVTANLYVPKEGKAPYPGVLFQMGHSNNGKSYALYQRCCQGLAQLGYVVLAFDPMGQGERTYYPKPGGWLTSLRSPTEEHTMFGRQMLLVGETATGAMLWDAVRSLDVLAADARVDAKRLATTGQSGGGTLSMILAAMDERLAAAVICSGNTENFAVTPFLAPGSSDDAEQDLVGSAPLGFDRWDMLWPMAPKPLLVAASAHDFFGTYSPAYARSGREEFAKLERAYTTLGAAANLGYYEMPLPHALSQPMRMAVYRWFERHLKAGGGTVAEEPPTKPETDEALWCGKTGNAVRDFGGRTPFAMTRARAGSILTPDAPADLRALLGMDAAPAAAPRLEVVATTGYSHCTVQAVEASTARQVWAPAWLFLPKREWSRLLVVVEPNGRNGAWHEDELCDRLASAGVAVCAMDVRGVGDLAPEFAPGAVGYARSHQTEENYAWASLILGRSLTGQRATDILGMTQALAGAYPRAEIVLAARERMTVPALCAAALEPRIARVYLAGHLISWRSVTDTERYTAPLSSMAPDALRRTDLPEIARSMAPRKVIVAGAVDAAGRAVPRTAAYEEVRETAAWDVETLAGI